MLHVYTAYDVALVSYTNLTKNPSVFLPHVVIGTLHR